MAEKEKKPWYQGFRKLAVGLACIGAGVYVISLGHIKEGITLIITGVGVFTGGNVVEHIIAKKNGG